MAPQLLHLERRKGGGGGGKGGGSSGGSGKGSSSSSSTGKGGSSSGKSGSSRGTSSGTRGGGSPIVISSGPFAGRQMGGGSRDSVYGTRTYGSGYPYGATGIFVVSRPFPFGFWPIYVGPHYYGNDEYGPVNNSSRPGGVLMSISLQPVPPSGNFSAVETYHIVGDLDSVQSVAQSVTSQCGLVNGTAQNLTVFHPETTIQWYRASSFALTLDGYNNTAALSSNAPTSSDSPPSKIPDTPLPTTLNSTALSCLNSTIAATVPILEGDNDGLSPTAIAGIVIGSILGALILLRLVIWAVKLYRARAATRSFETKTKIKEKPSDARTSTYNRVPVHDDADTVVFPTPSPIPGSPVKHAAGLSVPHSDYDSDARSMTTTLRDDHEMPSKSDQYAKGT